MNENSFSGSPSTGPAEFLPLATGQLGIWLGQMLDDAPIYCLAECVEITGGLDTSRFEFALRQLVAETDSFHLQFTETGNGPRQCFSYDPGWTLTQLDFSRESEPREAAHEWMRSDVARAFRTSGEPLFRFALLRLSPDRHYWYAIVHHAVIDGVGWQIFLSRLAPFYTRLVEGSQCALDPAVSWRAALAEEQAYRSSNSFRRDRDHWKLALADRPLGVSLSALPAQRPTAIRISSGRLNRSLDLKAVGRAHGAGSAAVLAAATAIYLHRATGARDMLVGMLASARVGRVMRSVVGYTSNILPVRMRVGPDEPIGAIIEQAARSIRTALRHQRYRIEDIRRDLGLRASDGELFRTVVNFIPAGDELHLAGCTIRRNTLSTGRVDDLQIMLFGDDHPEGLRIDLSANPALYGDIELEQHRDRFVELVGLIATADASATVGSISLTGAFPAEQAARKPDDKPAAKAADRSAGAPSTPTEVALAGIWRDVLRIATINRTDDFFDIGGDSLLANMLMTRVRKVFALELPLSAVFDAPELHALAAKIDASKSSAQPRPEVAIPPAQAERPAPLSFSQHRMWLIQSLDPGNTAYNISGALRLEGALDRDALASAVEAVYRRHEILRTSYDLAGGEIVQHVRETAGEPLAFVDLSGHADPAAEAARQANANAAIPIDLRSGPGFQVAVMRVGAADHILQLTLHHVAGDMWSMGVLTRELASLYNAARAGRAAALPPVPIRYRDYAVWQQSWLQSPERESQLRYWRRALEGAPPLELATDRPRPRIQSFNGAIRHASLPTTLLADLESLGRRQSATLFMTMLAAYATLLHRLAGQLDVSIGVPVAGRTHGDVEQVVGTFVNTLVMRVDLSGDPTFAELIGRVRATALEAFAHQEVPFDLLVQELVRTRDSSRAPLVQTMFNMGNAPMHGIDIDGCTAEYLHIDRGGAQFELSVSIDLKLSRSVVVEYNTDLFDADTIDRHIARYLQLLRSAVARPGTRLSGIDILPSDERRQLLNAWNETAVAPPRQTFIAMFEKMAAERADAPAVTFAGTTLSYRDLNARADVMAGNLNALGASRGVRVGVSLERSLDMLVALLAVQKSGGAYVPLDPALPGQRLSYMMSDSGIGVLVTSGGVAARLDIPPAVKVLDVAAPANERSNTGEAITAICEHGALASDPVYVIYTSGSTGKPKGVTISHGALANFLCSMQREPGLDRSDVLAAVTTISFDIAGLELYLPLMIGARIELVPTAVAGDGEALARLLHSSGATVMQATPATWRMLLDAEWKGAATFRALCGGEPLSRELADSLLDRVGALWNLYGPTETTIWSTAWQVQPGIAPISVGRPIDNTQIYVVKGGTPAPIGIAGEICIGGAGVAIEYHQRPELTAERFEANPFAADANERIYRTGDLGRWGADGRLYHLGRMDHQVKIRGFRIELGEIEAVLHTNPAIKRAVVVAHEVAPDDKRLVAYVTCDKDAELTGTELRRYLRQHLPDYMVPSLAITLDRLPLTPNGKVDRAALPDPFLTATRPANNFEPPANRREMLVAGIWRDLLKLDAVGVDDNFFDLGGHSLLALRFVAQVEARTGKRLDVRSLFFHKLRDIAALVPEAERTVG